MPNNFPSRPRRYIGLDHTTSHGRGRVVHRFTAPIGLTSPGPAVPSIQSKTIAEYRARNLAAKRGASAESCRINASVVLGPVWRGDYSASALIVQKLLHVSMGTCPDLGFGEVEVCDLANMHVRALKAANMSGKRSIASGRLIEFREIADVLRTLLDVEAHKVTTRNVPD